MSHDHDDFDWMPGIPHRLPDGERLLWQGRQHWFALARRAFRCNVVVAYFGLLWLLQVGRGLSAGDGLGTALTAHLWLAVPAAAAYALLAGLAWAFARTTVYSVTSERVLIRSGVALPMTVDIPLRLIEGAGLKKFADGTGDIELKLSRRQRAGYFLLWPNVRPWRIRRPEPTLRALSAPDEAADVITAALEASLEGAPMPARAGAVEESGGRVAPIGVAA